MEDKGVTLGLGHPEVYRLSWELDQLHNLWEKERAKRDKKYIVSSDVIVDRSHSSYKIVV